MKSHVAGLKADWQQYLRTLRSREIEWIFGSCPRDAFRCGLELGAGDGFQSTMLAPYVCRLISTDYRPLILAAPGATTAVDETAAPTGAGSPGDAQLEQGRVSYMTCDAERVADVFAPGTFDLVFSSNMLEHLPNPGEALAGIHSVMTDDGIAVHVIPSPFWKLSHLVGFYPNSVLRRLDRLSSRSGATSMGLPDQEWDNNPKVAGKSRLYLARLLWPSAHGASGSNLREFTLFTRRYWRFQFEAAGFRVAGMQRGPVSSGYGFGLDGIRTALERAGFSSETIYITYKAGNPSGRPERAGPPDRVRYVDARSNS